MTGRVTLGIGVCLVLFGGVVAWVTGARKDAGFAGAKEDSFLTDGSSRSNTPLADRLAKRREARAAETGVEPALLQAIYSRWDEAKRNLNGQALLDARLAIASDAVLQLGGGDGLLQFLEFLKKEGQGDVRQWVLTEGMKNLFSSPEKSAAAREWLLGLENAKFQEAVCFPAGQGFQGPGFKKFLDQLPNIHSQSSLMGGYFSEMAKHDPEGAIKGYFAARPPAVDFSALKHVMGAVPPGSDFVAISGMVPGDSQTLAKNARQALFGAWAASAPQETADYILSNTKLVHSDQLAPVIAQWMSSDPAAATAWVEGLVPGEHQDIALASQSKQLIPEDPAGAWQVALGIPDAKRREEAMKAVHREWMKKDPKSADAAWKEMSGGK